VARARERTTNTGTVTINAWAFAFIMSDLFYVLFVIFCVSSGVFWSRCGENLSFSIIDQLKRKNFTQRKWFEDQETSVNCLKQ
jgi:hypothetical protein